MEKETWKERLEETKYEKERKKHRMRDRKNERWNERLEETYLLPNGSQLSRLSSFIDLYRKAWNEGGGGQEKTSLSKGGGNFPTTTTATIDNQPAAQTGAKQGLACSESTLACSRQPEQNLEVDLLKRTICRKMK